MENEFRDEEETRQDTRVEYFEEIVEGEGDYTWTWYNFLGSVETRDGFVEVRDSNWNTIARIADQSALLEIDEVDAEVSGFAAAFSSVIGSLPAALSGEGVGFTMDDWHIYAFANGELLSTINYWGGEHFWTSWDGTEYKNIDTGFHFHDTEWNSLASSGSWERYRADEDGYVLIETSSNSGSTVQDPDAVAEELSNLNAGVEGLFGDDFANISELRLESRSSEGVYNALTTIGLSLGQKTVQVWSFSRNYNGRRRYLH